MVRSGCSGCVSTIIGKSDPVLKNMFTIEAKFSISSSVVQNSFIIYVGCFKSKSNYQSIKYNFEFVTNNEIFLRLSYLLYDIDI